MPEHSNTSSPCAPFLTPSYKCLDHFEFKTYFFSSVFVQAIIAKKKLKNDKNKPVTLYTRNKVKPLSQPSKELGSLQEGVTPADKTQQRYGNFLNARRVLAKSVYSND